MSFRDDRRHTRHDRTGTDRRDRLRRRWSSAIAASCRCTATGCSARFEESEDLTQETFLRAWRRRETYAARASLRAWLYRIATNACLDALEKRPRTPTRERRGRRGCSRIPDELLERSPPTDEPDAEVVARETIELAFMIAIQHLRAAPARRADPARRARLARAATRRELLETTEASVNCALQRARAGLKEHLPRARGEWAADGSAAERRAACALHRGLPRRATREALAALMHEDAALLDAARAGHVRRARHDRRLLGGGRLRRRRGLRRASRCLRHARQPPARGRQLRPQARARTRSARSRSTS